ncbi:MAG TPA: MerR family DNA-binding protein [Acidiferrobacter sp.]|nr:MerR family DNA-binding protein [Acidiferrobacter sp.]
MCGSENLATAFTIGQLAKACAISVEAVRFYEREGLIEQPKKPYAGIRHYPERTVERIQFIRHAQSLGFTLREVQEMLALRADDPASCGEARQLAEEKLVVLRAKMESLRFMESVLATLVDDCRAHHDPQRPCPILAAVGERARNGGR